MSSASETGQAIPLWRRLLLIGQSNRRVNTHTGGYFTGGVALAIVMCIAVYLVQLGTYNGDFGSGIITDDSELIDLEMKANESRIAARKGLALHCGLGPRPPTNEREERWAQIPVYVKSTDLLLYSHIHKTSGTSLSLLLARIFPEQTIVPSSHMSKGVNTSELSGKPAEWWEPFQVMFSHNRPNISTEVGIPDSKNVRLLLVVRNPLLHIASIYFESVCRYGLHIKGGVVDQEEATRARMKNPRTNYFSFCRDPELWVGSEQFETVYRNFQSVWLSYGGAYRHPCIGPQLKENQWNKAGDGCAAIQENGEDEAIWEKFFERSADAAIRRLEGALWVGVTERMTEAICLLFFTLRKSYHPLGKFRYKLPRPISIWKEPSIVKAERYEKADWRVFEAANDILDLRLWTAKTMLKNAGKDEREGLGDCFEVLTGANGSNRDARGLKAENMERITSQGLSQTTAGLEAGEWGG